MIVGRDEHHIGCLQHSVQAREIGGIERGRTGSSDTLMAQTGLLRFISQRGANSYKSSTPVPGCPETLSMMRRKIAPGTSFHGEHPLWTTPCERS